MGIGFTDIDLDADGRQAGFLDIPLSVHDDAWGVVRVPLAVVRNGAGPTVVLEGGNHGDEYEGPIALGELIRELDPKAIQGRLIFIPAINLPAVVAASRTSPVDGLNLNRSFPGAAFGTITQQIAAFVSETLFPIADAFLDLHSGGSSLDMVPSAVIEPAPDPAHHRRNIAASIAFGAPMTVVIDNLGDPRTATATAVRAGLTVVGTEMGGCGTVSLDALAVCRRGVRNVLAHLGVAPPDWAAPADPRPPLHALPGSRAYVLATEEGVFEPLCRHGETVSEGQPAGRIHFLANPGRPPVTLPFLASGVVYGKRHPGRVRPGNCCMVVASPYQGDLFAGG